LNAGDHPKAVEKGKCFYFADAASNQLITKITNFRHSFSEEFSGSVSEISAGIASSIISVLKDFFTASKMLPACGIAVSLLSV